MNGATGDGDAFVSQLVPVCFGCRCEWVSVSQHNDGRQHCAAQSGDTLISNDLGEALAALARVKVSVGRGFEGAVRQLPCLRLSANLGMNTAHRVNRDGGLAMLTQSPGLADETCCV